MVFIGNQTSCWASSPTEPFEYALSEGFDAFEWFPDKKPEAGWDDPDLDGPARAKIRQTASDRGMRLSLHARWQANPLCNDGRDLLAEDVRLACDLGAKLVNMHLFEEQGVPAFVEAIQPLIAWVAEAGLQLSIENTPHHSPEQFNELFAYLRERAPEANNVGMCLDIGHANLAAASRNDYVGFCDRLGLHVPIIHLHFHENWGDSDSHLPLFTGPASRDRSGIRALIERLKKRHFSGSIILEQWPQPRSALKDARNILREFWGPMPDPQLQVRVLGDSDTGLAKAASVQPATETPSDEPVAAQTKAAGPEPSQTGPAPDGDLGPNLTIRNRQARSWREKLQVVSDLLSSNTGNFSTDVLVELAIYLKFLGTGQIQCVEDGRHFRPAHHARLAAEIYERLERAKTDENEFILRKIYPWLPSFGSEFRRAEPLTRIRDIAHRNDISSDLKREIKTTLQNKLHRCAGPEDLETSSAILGRITAPGAAYPAEFVQEFKIFHEELKEFFNARSLEQRLSSLQSSVDADCAALIDALLQKKAGIGVEERMAAFRSLTELRKALRQNGKSSGAEGQSIVLADIGLEDFAFVLLSELINDSDKTARSTLFHSQGEALLLGLENLVLSGVEREETSAIGSELRVWLGRGVRGTDQVLRLRASILRCRRLTESFSERIIGLFSPKADRLGRGLGVAEHAIRVFCEADLRSHLVFQVSKLADALLKQTRQRLNLPAWDVLVPGRAFGQLVKLKSLKADLKTDDSPIIAAVDTASGDEEIPKRIAGIALAHELAHLSHLAVRARQAGVVFVACEEPGEFVRLKGLAGQSVRLEASSDKVSCEPAARREAPNQRASKKIFKLPTISLSVDRFWIALEETTVENSGAKAAGARRLAELAQQKDAPFQTPSGLVIPFGTMEAALKRVPDLADRYRDLVRQLNKLESADFIASSRQLRALIQKLQVPAEIIEEVRRRFHSGLIVRSSANGEDLAEFSGAGLYESVINVPPEEVAQAIRDVWASIWTRRAVESRRAAGVPHEQLHMAVLIQELVDAEFSFVLHTVHTLTGNRQELSAEIVAGLGETLVSGADAGAPYRLSSGKDSDSVTLTAFANFSHAARPESGSGLRREVLDYSQVELSRDPAKLRSLGTKLGGVGTFIERSLGAPQDIEGAVVNNRVYVVQARAQQGLPPQQG